MNRLLVLLLVLLATSPTWAQHPTRVPRWATASVSASGSYASYPWPRAVAVDEEGNVFTAGMFNDTVSFGRYTLWSAGKGDFYVAKYVPATGTWAWAVRGGGLDGDVASGLAVRNGCVYVTGYLLNNYRDDN